MTTTLIDRRNGIAEGLAVKAPCRVATTANIALSGLQIIDGVTLAAGDRVLVKDQTTASQNGIYDVSSGLWTRSPDFDGARDVIDGTLVNVKYGTANAHIVYIVVATDPIVIGTAGISFSVYFSRASLSSSLSLTITRAQIASTTITQGTFAVSGYATAGDLGSGAIYTSVGANSGSAGAIQDAAGTWFRLVLNGFINVGSFGAKGDGSTSDATAIAAAIAVIPAGGAILYFPAGDYVTAGGFTLANPAIVRGAGQRNLDAFTSTTPAEGTQIRCTSGATTLFNVTADKALFEDLTLLCTAANPTAGSGIHANSSNIQAMVNYSRITVKGFYDNIDSQAGSSWSMDKCVILGAVRYGVRIRNTVSSDYGDWWITQCSFAGRISANSTALISLESSGGGKIVNNKFNSGWGGLSTDGILINMSGENVYILQNSIDAVATRYAINIVNGGPYCVISDNLIANTQSTSAALYAKTAGNLLLGANSWIGNNASAPGIILEDCIGAVILPQRFSGFASVLVSQTGSSEENTDLSQFTPPKNAFIGPLDPRTPGLTAVAQATNNNAIFAYFQVNEIVTVDRVQFVVGTQSGNIDIGIFKGSSPYTLLASIGSTACPATGVHSVVFAASATVRLFPGVTYVCGWSADNTTATLLSAAGSIITNHPYASTYFTSSFPLATGNPTSASNGASTPMLSFN